MLQIPLIFTSLRPLFSFAWRMILTLTIARSVFVAWQWQRVVEADMLTTIFVQGFRFDLVLLGLMLIVPVLAYPVLASNRYLVPAWRGILRVLLPGILLLIVFLECSTPSFVDQFDSRPNILFLEYLNHPREVAATLWAAYRWPIIATVLLVSGLTWVNVRQIGKLVREIRPVGVLRAAAITPLLLILCVGMIRSTFDHRPVNPSTVALSTDPLVNELALNSTYTVLYAGYQMRDEQRGGFRYSDMSEAQAIAEVRDAMAVDAADFLSPALPTFHQQHGAQLPDRPKNLVLIIEESLGAEFVGALGGLPLTPNLDALAAEGIWFSRLYATGTRSVRGLEAVVSGFTPTPARSVVKLPKSQRDFFTLADLLSRHGYATSFIYGGEAQFDNMRRFFMNNGFATVVDEKDYQDPEFVGSWGVSDEDLFRRADAEFEQAGDQPFFSVVFTSSNHTPFEYPDGRIEPYDAEKHTVNNAVKYADYALGQFFENAKTSSYWDDTVFLVVADHNSRVYGNEIVPVSRFHIPGLILGGPIEAAQLDTLASQIDLGPTLLSLIGVESAHPMIGHDLTLAANQALPGRAIMQFNTTQAYMEDDKVIVLQKDREPRQFLYADEQLVEDIEHDDALIERALAHSVWSSVAYQNSIYRLPPRGSLQARL